MPRKPCASASSTREAVRSSFQAVPYRKRGTLTPSIDTVRSFIASLLGFLAPRKIKQIARIENQWLPPARIDDRRVSFPHDLHDMPLNLGGDVFVQRNAQELG